MQKEILTYSKIFYERVVMIGSKMDGILKYYSHSGNITKIGKYSKFLDWLTDDPRAIYQVVQGLLIHDLWVENYGIKLNKTQEYQQNIAYMEDILDKAIELDSRSLSIPRAPKNRVICCCREFATLMCAILRHKGIPASSGLSH